MKRIIFAFAALAALAADATAQYKPEWQDKPVIHPISKEQEKESAVFVLDGRHLEYEEDGENITIHRTIHRIIKVLDEKGLESFNKFTIPASSDGRNIEKIKARTILPSGKIIELGKDKIRLSKNEEGGQEYVFAMEGMEKNAEVELLYTEKRGFSVFGTENLQFNIPVLTAEFTLTAPERLRFDVKGYNGYPAATDTLIDGQRSYRATATNVPGVLDEQYSNYEASLMRVDYRLSYTLNDNPDVRLFTWNDLVKRLYNLFYTYTPREEKTIRKYLSSIGVDESESELQKIKKIEETIKSNINISGDITDESYSDFDKIIDKKVTTEESFTRFFIACLKLAGVEHEVGMTTNRFNYPLDEKFENWKLLEFYVIYFPKQKRYLVPTSLYYRMPFVPLGVTGNKVIFCKTTTIGDMTSAVASIRTVPVLPIETTNNNVDADISFSSDMTPQIDITHSFGGYSAMGMRETFTFGAKDKEKDIVKQLIGVASTSDDIKSYNIENVAFANYYDNKPVKIHVKVQSPQLMEKAGAKYIFKVGDVIGRQVEMYQEKERKLPVDLPYPHTLYRTIVINIPAGYKIANPEAVRIYADHKNAEGKQTMAFISDYKLEANKMTITINEFYDQLHYPVSDIEPFKKVINASADFNKVVLMLEKN